MSDTGSNLTVMRKKRGLTASQLGELVGVSEATISRYETGERKLSVEMAKKIATALHIKSWWKLYD